VVKPDPMVQTDIPEDAVVIEMGNPDQTINFSQDFVAIVKITATTTPRIYYYNKDTDLYELAGKYGVKDGITYVQGGTVLAVEDGVYTIGLLLDHMSVYVSSTVSLLPAPPIPPTPDEGDDISSTTTTTTSTTTTSASTTRTRTTTSTTTTLQPVTTTATLITTTTPSTTTATLTTQTTSSTSIITATVSSLTTTLSSLTTQTTSQPSQGQATPTAVYWTIGIGGAALSIALLLFMISKRKGR